jgi:hypothetical protein
VPSKTVQVFDRKNRPIKIVEGEWCIDYDAWISRTSDQWGKWSNSDRVTRVFSNK